VGAGVGCLPVLINMTILLLLVIKDHCCLSHKSKLVLDPSNAIRNGGAA
jgi:hypothetical protein